MALWSWNNMHALLIWQLQWCQFNSNFPSNFSGYLKTPASLLTYLFDCIPFTKLYNHGEWLSIISKGLFITCMLLLYLKFVKCFHRVQLYTDTCSATFYGFNFRGHACTRMPVYAHVCLFRGFNFHGS